MFLCWLRAFCLCRSRQSINLISKELWGGVEKLAPLAQRVHSRCCLPCCCFGGGRCPKQHKSTFTLTLCDGVPPAGALRRGRCSSAVGVIPLTGYQPYRAGDVVTMTSTSSRQQVFGEAVFDIYGGAAMPKALNTSMISSPLSSSSTPSSRDMKAAMPQDDRNPMGR